MFGVAVSVFVTEAVVGLIVYACVGLYVLPIVLASHFYMMLLTSEDINWHRKWLQSVRYTHPLVPNRGVRQPAVITFITCELRPNRKDRHGVS